MKTIFLLLLWLQSALCFATQNISNTGYELDEQHQVNVAVDLFLSSTCPHCHMADDFFGNLEKKNPWLKVRRHLINQDKQALRDFYQRLKQEGAGTNFFVPAIFFCQSHWTGFSNAQNSGDILFKNIQYCRQKIMQEGVLSPTTIRVLKEKGEASQFFAKSGELSQRSSFIFLAGVTDSFAACNFFCIIAFLSLLWLLPWHIRTQWLGGAIFVVNIGLMHYLQQSHADFYNSPIPGLLFYTILAGFLLLCVARYPTKSLVFTIIVGAITLCIVYYYQQTCLFNMAYIFEQWLNEQNYLANVRDICILIYQICYVFPLIALIIIWNLLSQWSFIKRHKISLRWFARAFLFYMSILLMVYPSAIANVPMFYLTLLISIITAKFMPLQRRIIAE